MVRLTGCRAICGPFEETMRLLPGPGNEYISILDSAHFLRAAVRACFGLTGVLKIVYYLVLQGRSVVTAPGLDQFGSNTRDVTRV